MTDVLTHADHVDEVSSRRAVPVDVEGMTVGVPDRDEPILGPIDLHLGAGSRVLVSCLLYTSDAADDSVVVEI